MAAAECMKYLQAYSRRRGTSSNCDEHWCMWCARHCNDGKLHLHPNCYDLKFLIGFIGDWEGHVSGPSPTRKQNQGLDKFVLYLFVVLIGGNKCGRRRALALI
eukprot:3541432-Pyramimonas_sp.AAC.1